MTTLVDARGLKCPWPAIRAGRALRQGAVALRIEADDPAAERELAALASARGLAFAVAAPGVYAIGDAAP